MNDHLLCATIVETCNRPIIEMALRNAEKPGSDRQHSATSGLVATLQARLERSAHLDREP